MQLRGLNSSLGRFVLFFAESPAAYTRSATPKKSLSCSVFGPNTRDPQCKKQTLSTRGLDKTSLNHSVYVVLPSRRAEEFKENYLKKRTNEECVLVRLFRGMIAVCRVMCVPTL